MKLLRISDFPEMPKRTQWGPWRYDSAAGVVEHVSHDGAYFSIWDDEDGPITDAGKWDIVRHVSGKQWATPDVVGWLVLALDEAA